jgi:hypothetical protein
MRIHMATSFVAKLTNFLPVSRFVQDAGKNFVEILVGQVPIISLGIIPTQRQMQETVKFEFQHCGL